MKEYLLAIIKTKSKVTIAQRYCPLYRSRVMLCVTHRLSYELPVDYSTDTLIRADGDINPMVRRR